MVLMEQVRALNRFTSTCPELTLCVTFCACLVLEALGLGKVVRSVRTFGGGRPIRFYAKEPLRNDMSSKMALLGVSNETVPSLQACSDSMIADAIPIRAPDPGWGNYILPENRDDDLLRYLGLEYAPGQEDLLPAPLQNEAVEAADNEADGGLLPAPLQNEALEAAENEADGGFGH
jgi:hypothetical protein